MQKTALAEQFDSQGYALLKGFLPDDLRMAIYGYMLKMEHAGKMLDGDPLVPGTPALYGDPLLDSVLDMAVPDMAAALGMELVQSFCYGRIYKTGDVLIRHSDRDSCEIAMTMPIGYVGNEPWPIFLEANNKALKVVLEPGDALLYKGYELEHWRDALKGEHQVQIFMFFVDKAGKYADFAFDKWDVEGTIHTSVAPE